MILNKNPLKNKAIIYPLFPASFSPWLFWLALLLPSALTLISPGEIPQGVGSKFYYFLIDNFAHIRVMADASKIPFVTAISMGGGAIIITPLMCAFFLFTPINLNYYYFYYNNLSIKMRIFGLFIGVLYLYYMIYVDIEGSNSVTARIRFISELLKTNRLLLCCFAFAPAAAFFISLFSISIELSYLFSRVKIRSKHE